MLASVVVWMGFGGAVRARRQRASSVVAAAIALLALACADEASIGDSATNAADEGAGSSREDASAPTSSDAGSTASPEARFDAGPDAGLELARNTELAVASVAETLDVVWEDCSLHTGTPIGENPWDTAGDAGAVDAGSNANEAGGSEPAPAAECATVSLPLRWSEPSGEQLDWFVKRLPATETPRGQVWLLQGGPGSPGTGMEYLARDLHGAVPDLDVYIPDHRGVGRSTLFECENAKRGALQSASQLAACGTEIAAEWGSNTKEFSTTAASRDVLAFATHLNRADEEVVIWGGSYGGYWVHRILQVDRAGLVTAAVIDSAVLPTGGQSTLEQVLKPEEAGRTLLEHCAQDDECSERLGNDPEARALSIMEDLCSPFQLRGGRLGVQALFSAALRQWGLLRLIPAMLYRVERCTDQDVAYLDAYADATSSVGPPFRGVPEAPASEALFINVMYSEIVSEVSDAQSIIDASNASVFSDIAGSSDLSTALESWPRYSADDYIGKWADTDIPLLILHGGLDTQARPSDGHAIAEHFTHAGQQYFFFPTGSHGIYYRTHDTKDDPELRCGEHLTLQFLEDPTKPVDGSCIDDAEPLDFSANEQTLLDLAGHTDPWDNP